MRWTLPLSLSLLLGLLLACSSPATPAPTAAPKPASGADANAKPAASGPPTSYADLANYRGADREQVLYTGAKQEGTLAWYTTLAGDILTDLKAGFEAKYPGVKVQE